MSTRLAARSARDVSRVMVIAFAFAVSATRTGSTRISATQASTVPTTAAVPAVAPATSTPIAATTPPIAPVAARPATPLPTGALNADLR